MSGLKLRIPKAAAWYLYRRAGRRLARGQLAAAHRDWARAARAGYAPAQCALARAYQLGQGCVRCGGLAEHWYRLAAENGDRDAQFELGLILLNDRNVQWMTGASAAWAERCGGNDATLAGALFPQGLGARRDPVEAFAWLLRAAGAGKPEAQANVGWLLLEGAGCEPDRAQALHWFSAAAEHGIGQAAHGLAKYYGTANAPDCDPVASAHWARMAAELGSISGAYRFGVALRDGIGVQRDLEAAERQFEQAAEQGHLMAGFESARLRLARAPNEAETWRIVERLRTGAKRGHTQSAMLLAELYRLGERIKPDLREAAVWCQLAAKQGDLQAQYTTGCHYAGGEGVPADLRHAARYYEVAAGRGHPRAAYNLAVLYLNGQGVDQDAAQGKRWLRVAADAGLSHAQLRLGQILATEASTQTEASSAQALIERAAESGNRDAKVVFARRLLDHGGEDAVGRAVSLLKEAARDGAIEACSLLLNVLKKESDLRPILDLLRRRAQDGKTQARVLLARELISGRHAQKDEAAAIELLMAASRDDSAQANFELGGIFCQGVIVEKNVARGFHHYMKAATLNHAYSQYNVGLMLFRGMGVAKDAEEGIRWIQQASARHVEQARKFIANLDSEFGQALATS